MVGFIIFTTHYLIIFPSVAGEVWFDIFILSSFAVLLSVMLLLDKFQCFVINNSIEVRLSNITPKDRINDIKSFEFLHNNKLVFRGTQDNLQQQLLNILKGKIEPDVLIAFVNNFHRFELNQSAIEEVNPYIGDGSNTYELIPVKKGSGMPQIKVVNQELVVIQKGIYKKTNDNNQKTKQLRKAEYLYLRQTYKIKKNTAGNVVKYDERISVKAMSSIEFALPF